MKITLKHPVTIGEKVIAELTFRRPKMKDFDGLPLVLTEFTHLKKLAGRLCDQPDVVMNEIDVEDVGIINDTVTDFLVPSPTTGKIT